MTARESAEASCTLLRPDGVRLHYRLARAPAARRGRLVLIHGLASNLTRWSEFLDHTALRANWDLLRLDLRGHGESAARCRLSMEGWSDDLAATLDAAGGGRSVIVGHSLGAHVAVHFAARHPHQVAALVLIDPLLCEAVQGGVRWLARLTPLLRLVVGGLRLVNALGVYRRRIPARDLRALDEETRTLLAASGDPQEIVRRYSSPLDDLRYIPAANYLEELAELLRPLPLAALSSTPVLVLLSRGITFTDPVRTRATLAPLGRLTVEEIDAFHWPLTEKPEAVRRAIERFCEEQVPAG